MDLSLVNSHSHLQTLAERLTATPGNPSLVNDANKIASRWIDFAASPSQFAIPDKFLEDAARLVSIVDLPRVSAAFCVIVAACWTNNQLFPLFKNAVRTAEPFAPSFALPTWWPCQSGFADSGVVFSTGATPNASNPANGSHASNRANRTPSGIPFFCFWATMAWAPEMSSLPPIAALAALAVDTMNAISAIISLLGQMSQSYEPYKKLLEVMLTSVAHRDLAMVIMFQMQNAYSIIHSASASGGSRMVTKSADLVSNIIMHRAACSSIALHILHLPDAAEVQKAYGANHADALQLAATSPFGFVIDVLNQGRSLKWHRTSIIAPCVETAAAKLEQWSGLSGSKLKLYGDFNYHCHTKNVLAVLCEFGFTISHTMLSWCGQDMLILAPINEIFPAQALPPIAKPAYFLITMDFGNCDEAVQMMHSIDAYGDLLLSITLVLKTVLNVIDDELAASAKIVATPEIAKKLLTEAVEQILGLLVAATYCSLKYQPRSSYANTPENPPLIPVLCGVIVEKIVAFAEAEPAIWISLFNFANDACYADLRLVEVFEELFDRILVKKIGDNNKELVTCGILLFVTTFLSEVNDRLGISKYCDVKPARIEQVEVESSEYKFLYANQQSKKTTSEGDIARIPPPPTTGSVASSRLKSSNRFGK